MTEDKATIEHLMSEYGLTKDQAIRFKREYDLLILNTESQLTIDEVIKVILNANDRQL